jgi:hypothetical protein
MPACPMPACIGLTDDQIVPPHEGVPTDAAPCNVGFNNVTTGTTTCKINVTNFCAGAKNLTACRDYAAAHTACPEKYDDVQANGECAPFDFRRLGLRSTALLLSPWVQKGKVFQQPVGPSSTSQFEHQLNRGLRTRPTLRRRRRPAMMMTIGGDGWLLT